MEKNQIQPYRTHVSIWLALVALTAITITVANLHLGRWSIFAAIFIAVIKGTLVLWYFMNLKFEEALFKIMLGVAMVTLTVIMLLTFADISFR